MRLLLSLAFAFEPLAPVGIGYFLSISLRDLERQGLITDFKAHSRRLGKFHYVVEIYAEVTSKQAHYILSHILYARFKALGRWFDV